MAKNFSIVLKKSTTDAIKTDSKKAIQKTEKATGDLIGKKIADKITSVSKKSSAEKSMELHSKKSHSDNQIEAPKKKYKSPEERRQIIEN